jgi:peroxiredoxin
MSVVSRRGLAGLLTLFGLHTAQAAGLDIGQPAPGFTLNDQAGNSVFRDDQPSLRKMNVQILGVSLDDSASHAQFAEKYRLPFPLLTDGSGEVTKRYGALTSFGPFKFAKRQTFLIDPEGRIAKIYRDVKASTHSREIQQDLKALLQSPGS